MKISKEDIKILVDLYKSIDGLTAFIFFQRYKYGPALVFKTVQKLEEKKYVISNDDKIHITEAGKEFVERNRFIFSKNKYSRIPDEFLAERLQVNEPYLPNIEKLPNEILNLKTKGDG